MRRRASGLLLAALVCAPAGAELKTWVDERGHTHVTDDPAAVPEAMRGRVADEPDELGELWHDGLRGPPLPAASGETSSDADRAARLLRGAVDDLGRGETARASAALETVLRLEPGRAEAHWYLALLDRQRGRFDSAESHLRAFLAGAGDALEPWRASAQRRLRELADERRLAAATPGSDAALRLHTRTSPHFQVRYDAELGEVRADLADTVVAWLEEAHARVGERLGVVPAEPVRVVVYGKAAYRRAHRDRFSFRTVGFFDGRIHVASAAHPGGELRSLLHHEYTHALFRERVGSDRPLWLNEGLAELSERASRSQAGLTRAERFRLQGHGAAGTWIPLARLALGYGGLDDAQAKVAYLQGAAAAAWIEARTDRAARARLLDLLGQGLDADAALRAVVGADTAGLESALQREIASEFATSGAAAPAE
jgi:hypothetical protein